MNKTTDIEVEVVVFVETGEEWSFWDWREFGVEVDVRAQKSQSGLIKCLNSRSQLVGVGVESVGVEGVGVGVLQ